MNTKRALLLLIALMMLPTWVMAQTATATITVQKIWGGNAPIEVNVQLDCNDGQDAVQDHDLGLAPDDDHNFVVVNFAGGDMDCWVTEDVSPGRLGHFQVGGCSNDDTPDGSPNECWDDDDLYGGGYWNDDSDYPAPNMIDKGFCRFTSIPNEAELTCTITNRLMLHRVDVEKEWIDENPGLGNPQYANGRLECNAFVPNCVMGDDPWPWSNYSGAGQGKGNADYLQWDSDGDVDYGYLCPATSGTSCWVTEKVHASDVETDVTDCVFNNTPGSPNAGIMPGDWTNTCTVVNTRIYEGVPTLSQYGLGVLALLMLGVGMVGFRRFA